MRTRAEFWLALAGREHVQSYTRTSSTGKVVHVSAYTRDPGKMTNKELFNEAKALSQENTPGIEGAQKKNRLALINTAIRKRRESGFWDAGSEDKGQKPSAVAKVAAKAAPKKEAPGEEGKPTAVARVAAKVTGKKPQGGSKKVPGPKDENFWTTQFTPEEAKAHRDKLTKTLSDYIEKNGDTSQQFGVKGADGEFKPGVYTPERKRIHDLILSEFFSENEHVPHDKKAVLSGGLGGSGKGFVLKNEEHGAGVDESQYMTIDPDKIKEKMIEHGLAPEIDGVTPLETAWLIHEESSDISKRLTNVAIGEGRNVVLDNTMGSDSVFRKVQALKDEGYDVEGVFVDVPVQTSIDAAFSRHMNGLARHRKGMGLGGRFVPEFLQKESKPIKDPSLNSRNRERFDELASLLTRARVFDNSGEADPKTGERPPPKLVSDVMTRQRKLRLKHKNS